MKIYLKFITLVIIALGCIAVNAQNSNDNFPVKTDKYGFYNVLSTPTSIAFCKASTVQNADGEYVVNIYSGRQIAQSITCTDVTSGDLHFLDANFDGNIDIMVGPASPRNYSTILLWSDDKHEFVPMSEDNTLNGFFLVDPKNKVWVSMGSGSYCSTYYQILKWKGNKLVPVESLIEISDPKSYSEYGVRMRYTIIKGGDYSVKKANRKQETNKRTKLPLEWRKILSAFDGAIE